MEQYAKEITKRFVKPKHFRPVIAAGVDDTWGLDLADMAEWHASNEGYKYILVVVDVFSRYAWCRALKTKDAKDVWDALQTILDKQQPKHIWVDKGSEFYNKLWDAKLKALDISRYSTYSDAKVSIAERFIRTLKTKIWFQVIVRGTHKWIDLLQPIVETYNETKHSTIKMTPTEAREPYNEEALLDEIESPPLGKPKYKLGQWVRIHRMKGTFEKGFHPNFSYEIYKIVGIRVSQPVMYLLP